MGKNTETISGKRFQIYNDEEIVHVHDDKLGIKFEGDKDDFKEEVETALNDLEESDGIVKIKGKNKSHLYLIKEGKNFNVFVIEEKSTIKKELKNFLKRL